MSCLTCTCLYVYISPMQFYHMCIYVCNYHHVKLQDCSNATRIPVLFLNDHTSLPPSLFSIYLLFFEILGIIKRHQIMKISCVFLKAQMTAFELLKKKKKMSPGGGCSQSLISKPGFPPHSPTWVGGFVRGTAGTSMCVLCIQGNNNDKKWGIVC